MVPSHKFLMCALTYSQEQVCTYTDTQTHGYTYTHTHMLTPKHTHPVLWIPLMGRLCLSLDKPLSTLGYMMLSFSYIYIPPKAHT